MVKLRIENWRDGELDSVSFQWAKSLEHYKESKISLNASLGYAAECWNINSIGLTFGFPNADGYMNWVYEVSIFEDSQWLLYRAVIRDLIEYSEKELMRFHDNYHSIFLKYMRLKEMSRLFDDGERDFMLHKRMRAACKGIFSTK